MNIEKWIEEKGLTTQTGDDVILIDDLIWLLRDYAIVPREPSDEMIAAGFIAVNEHNGSAAYAESICYKAMIKAAEEE